MDDLASQVTLVESPHLTRRQLSHPLDGRYGPLDPGHAARRARELLERIDQAQVDAVIGIPEGGTIPAYAFASAAGLPLHLATRTAMDMPGPISFVEPHVTHLPPFVIYGLERGTRVVIVEDEVTTGRTLVNAVRALRDAGMEVPVVGTFLLVDHPETVGRLDEAGIRIEACVRLDPSFLGRVTKHGA